MKCPFCDIEMTEGFIQSARKIYFTKEKHIMFMYPEGDDITLSENNWTAPTVKAWHCEKCNKFILDGNSDENK